MGAVETLKAAVAASTTMDATSKAIAGDFLMAAGPVIEALGPEALADVLACVARGEAAPNVVVEALRQEQVVALLGQTEMALAGMLERRAAQQAAARAALAGLADAALAIVARLIVGAL